MYHALIDFLAILERKLNQGDMSELQPKFVLVGSAREGTRIGLANEMDVLVKFRKFESVKEAPFRVQGAFSLAKADTESASAMDEYFCGSKFNFHKFKEFMLDAVRKSVIHLFENKSRDNNTTGFDVPMELDLIIKNKDWIKSECFKSGTCKELKMKTGVLFTHCEDKKCQTSVCQTKPGIALQLKWTPPFKNWRGDSEGRKPIYTSIDLIPVFDIEPIGVLQLARTVNTQMFSSEEVWGWLSYLTSYFKHYKEIKGDEGTIRRVVLKTMNSMQGNNYYVRPSLPYIEEIFKNEKTKKIYSYIKYLKRVLDLDISSYFIKNELRKEQYQTIMKSCITDEAKTFQWDLALVTILFQTDFKSKLEGKIDIEKSAKNGYICLHETKLPTTDHMLEEGALLETHL